MTEKSKAKKRGEDYGSVDAAIDAVEPKGVTVHVAFDIVHGKPVAVGSFAAVKSVVLDMAAAAGKPVAFPGLRLDIPDIRTSDDRGIVCTSTSLVVHGLYRPLKDGDKILLGFGADPRNVGTYRRPTAAALDDGVSRFVNLKEERAVARV